MKRKCIILSCFALIFAVAALMAGSKFLIPAYAMDEFATPTDLDDIDEPWPINIIPGEQIELTLDKNEYGLLILTPQTTGVYTFISQQDQTQAGAVANITLYDMAGNVIPVYLDEYDLLNGFENSNLNVSQRSSPMAILNHNEMIRILVRLNWDNPESVPTDGQIFPMSVSFAPLEGFCGDELTWNLNLNTRTLLISGSGPMDNYASIGSAPWSSHGDQVQHVLIDNATTIGDYAFSKTGITDILIPETVHSIGRSVFNWTGLQNVTIGSHVTEVDTNAFDGASNLNVHCEVGSAALEVAKLKNVQYTYIPFANTLTLPDDTITIESKAFANLGEHVNIQIPAGTANIASDAFDESMVLLLVVPGSPAETWANNHSIPYLPIE